MSSTPASKNGDQPPEPTWDDRLDNTVLVRSNATRGVAHSADAHRVRLMARQSMLGCVEGDLTMVTPFVAAIFAYIQLDMPDPSNHIGFISHVSSRTTDLLQDAIGLAQHSHSIDNKNEAACDAIKESSTDLVHTTDRPDAIGQKDTTLMSDLIKRASEVQAFLAGVAVCTHGAVRLAVLGAFLHSRMGRIPVAVVAVASIVAQGHFASGAALVAGGVYMEKRSCTTALGLALFAHSAFSW